MKSLTKVSVLLALIASASLCGTVQAEEYTYGQPVDVAKVISINTPDSQDCEVVKSTMEYLDSHGNKKEMVYLRLAEICNRGK